MKINITTNPNDYGDIEARIDSQGRRQVTASNAVVKVTVTETTQTRPLPSGKRLPE